MSKSDEQECIVTLRLLKFIVSRGTKSKGKCAKCGEEFKLGDKIMHTHARYYHKHCYDQIYLDVPDVSDEELEDFFIIVD